MKNKLFIQLILVFLGSFSLWAQELKIIIPSDVYKDYEKFVAGKNPYSIDSYDGEFSRRDVVEVILALKALKLGGYDKPVKVSQLDSYSRILAEVEKGNFALCANTVWTRDIDSNKFYVSNETLKDGEFFAGLYASLENKKFFEIKSKQELKKFKAVSNSSWTSDWEILSQLSLTALQDVKQWEQMVRMVSYKRVDFLLAPFQNNEKMSLNFENISLYPLLGFKIALPGSRAFVLSKKYPHGEEIFKSFNKGLEQLIKTGEVKKAYEQSGFVNRATSKWEVIN